MDDEINCWFIRDEVEVVQGHYRQPPAGTVNHHIAGHDEQPAGQLVDRGQIGTVPQQANRSLLDRVGGRVGIDASCDQARDGSVRNLVPCVPEVVQCGG